MKRKQTRTVFTQEEYELVKGARWLLSRYGVINDSDYDFLRFCAKHVIMELSEILRGAGEVA